MRVVFYSSLFTIFRLYLGVTSIMFAAQNGYNEIVQILINHGADINATNVFGNYLIIFNQNI